MKPVEKALEEARELLIDMTPRNRLLNFKPTKRRTIKIVEATASEVYEALVLKEEGLAMISIEADLPTRESPDDDRNAVALRTEFDEEEHFGRLSYVYREAHSTVEEQGYTGLHLALSFLRWSESPFSQQTWLAPLLLVPVEIKRAAGGRRYECVWTKEDVHVNFALQAKLKEAHDLQLPELDAQDDPQSIERFHASLKDMIATLDWQIEESIYVDFFNFTKIIMYRDLAPTMWPPERSPLESPLLQLFFDPQTSHDPHDRFPVDEIDTKLDFRRRYWVMDADPSQIAVIEDVRAGRNMVVQGPPGTGKSQTIVNLIAEMLATGKKVLFVSEKMAALEVVKRRLDEVGLGDFCLELHSRKANKKQFIEQLKKIPGRPKPGAISSEAKFAQFDDARKRLNQYAAVLREKCCGIGKSLFEVICLYEEARKHYERQNKSLPAIKIDDAVQCTQQEWSTAVSSIKQLTGVMGNNVKGNPWYGCEPPPIGFFDIEDIRALIEQCRSMAEIVSAPLREWELFGIRPPSSLGDIPAVLETLDLVMQGREFGVTEPHIISTAGSMKRDELDLILGTLESFQGTRRELSTTFAELAFENETGELLDARDKLFTNAFILRHPIQHCRLLQRFRSLFREHAPTSSTELLASLERLNGWFTTRKAIEGLALKGAALFGALWRGESTDCELLRAFHSWGKRFNESLKAGAVNNQTVHFVCLETDHAKLKTQLSEFRQACDTLERLHQLITERLKADYQKIFNKSSLDLTLSDLRGLWNRWNGNLPTLRNWSVFVATRKGCLDTIARPLLVALDAGLVELEDLHACFNANFARSILDEVSARKDPIRTFNPDLHAKTIQDFQGLDRDLIDLNQERLAQKLIREQLKIPDHPARGTPAQVLKKEMSKQKNHKTIRAIFGVAGEIIQGLKPCVMVSPLSIAQFLEPGRIFFDIVIFDEASQMKPADALGAILRSKQLVVFGDSRQLPPTSFFDQMIDIGEDDVELKDMPSLLELCESHLTNGKLKWHYRSEHESLIAVSNQEFYDNELLIYPSPEAKNQTLGLHFEHVPDGKYEPVTTRSNRIEARVLAERAISHYQKWPELSLGIGTFNIQQAEAIWEEIDTLLPKHPEIEGFFERTRHEHFFVKNLETIQGDERDVIFVSVGHGFDQEGHLSQNFGPLNKDGGERRLNVLMTRARKKCVLFANFRGSDLTVNAASARGVKALKAFLEYAETGFLPASQNRAYESEFEKSVADVLFSQLGIRAHPQVGCAGYRIDLGVPHPSIAGRYLLGIECDGATYHSSMIARERDRLREQVLKMRGWRIERVWSTDWYWNRSQAEDRLISTVRQAIDAANRESAGVREEQAEDFEARRRSEADQTFVASKAARDVPTEIIGAGAATEEDVLVAPIEKMEIPLLLMIWCNGEELNAEDHCYKVQDYYWTRIRDSKELQLASRKEFSRQLGQVLKSLHAKDFLRKSDYGDWLLTEKGRAELDSWGLLPA